MALGDGGNLEAVSGGNPVVDGEGREQDEAVSGGGLAGVPVEDLVVEVAEEASVVSRGGDLGAEQHRRLGLTATRQAVGDDVPEELPDRRNGRDRIVPGLLGSARVSMARAASWSISGRQPVAWAGNWQASARRAAVGRPWRAFRSVRGCREAVGVVASSMMKGWQGVLGAVRTVRGLALEMAPSECAAAVSGHDRRTD
ncbi:hypothetical protein [Streptomyces sp. NPDC001893]|uniref:hypothetical protein n=1 Tax=Streptomyces sp. NPDC001893 TaxID=3154530 RepID=UPI00332319B9